jgi:3-hydroxy-9,10-secoandrosta-1,3,5(10)-triene-9,17-dione monooxygenase reductase component
VTPSSQHRSPDAPAPAGASFDATEFRKALGSFATGVTIITARAPDGAKIGLTANSFNSVSLEPPLVLWSLANNAMSFDAFRAASHWAVHVLGAEQEDLSGRFARRGEDKFAGLDTDDGEGGVPLLRGCAARFECRTVSQYQGGDHLIFIGEVLRFDRDETAPLVFHGGKYAHATRRDPPDIKPRAAHLAGSFGEDFLGYLLGRSHFRFFAQIRPFLDREGLGDMEFYVLSTLTLKPLLTENQIAEGMAGVLDDNRQRALEGLVERGFAQRTAEGYALTGSGREAAIRLISAAKATESQVLERLGAGDAAILKTTLNRLLGVVDERAADVLWEQGEEERRQP